MRKTFFNLFLVLAVSFMGIACGDGGDSSTGGSAESSGGEIVIGTVFHDSISSSAKLRLDAVKMAADEINAAGGIHGKTLKVVNMEPIKDGKADGDTAAEKAKALHDTEKAVGVISLFSSLGKSIIGVTNTADYENFVQCNVSATSPPLNDASVEGSDKNDTFYRTVVSDTFQGALMAKIIEENKWSKVAIYYLDDAFGKGIYDNVKKNNVTYSVEKTFPAEFKLDSEKANIDEILADKPDVIALASLKAQGPDIVEYIVSSGYKGGLLLTDGVKNEEMFNKAKSLGAWLKEDGNVLIGTEPDNYGGKNSDAFSAAFETKIGEAVNSYSSSAYDCAYAFAFALAKAGKKDSYAPKDVKDNISIFKQANQSDDLTEIGIGGDEFKKGVTALESASAILYEGASGRLLWDANGDRVTSGMRTYKVSDDGTAFVTLDRYDADLKKVGLCK